MMSISPYHACATCGRLIGETDAHRQCQKCRHGGRWRRPHWRHQHIKAMRAAQSGAKGAGDG